jgi:hypothetical protein
MMAAALPYSRGTRSARRIERASEEGVAYGEHDDLAALRRSSSLSLAERQRSAWASW